MEYLVPASTIYELEELIETEEPIVPDPQDEQHVRKMMEEIARFFRDPFIRKRMEKELLAPWSKVVFPFPN
ncbi:hypothetical protein MXD62_09685, partial [Frankia sp. Mgl5]